MYPGDPSAPAEEVINCHCVLVSVVEKSQAEQEHQEEHRLAAYENQNTGLKYHYTYGKLSAGDEVVTPDERTAIFEKWVRGSKVETIAGYGSDREIDDIDRIVNRFGGLAKQWMKQKRKGIITTIDDSGNEEFGVVDFHWYYEPSVGIIERKIKQDERTGE